MDRQVRFPTGLVVAFSIHDKPKPQYELQIEIASKSKVTTICEASACLLKPRQFMPTHGFEQQVYWAALLEHGRRNPRNVLARAWLH